MTIHMKNVNFKTKHFKESITVTVPKQSVAEMFCVLRNGGKKAVALFIKKEGKTRGCCSELG